MADDNFSCIKEVTKTVHITLPTTCTSNEINGVSDVLESWKCQYNKQLQAVVVSYKNVSLTSVLGYIKLDYPFILCDIKATFELFYPTVGSILKGKINRVSHDYIGCLVHDTINVTIDRPSDTSDISNVIILDRFILFQITQLNFKRKILHVKGIITEECIRLMKECSLLNVEVDVDNGLTDTLPDTSESGKRNERLGYTDEFSDSLISEELSTDSAHRSPRKKKSKKSYINSPDRNFIPNSVQGSSLEFENSTDTSSHVSYTKKKKKHKKESLTSPSHFSASLESTIDEIQSTQHPETASKKHKSKARKKINIDSTLHVENEINTDSSSNRASPVKSPQKKKSKKIKTSSPEKNIKPKAFSENSISESDYLSSPTKKKKHKKSKEDSLKSLEDKTELMQPPKSIPKKKSKSGNSSKKLMQHLKNVDSPLKIKEEIHSDSPNRITSPLKSKKNSASILENFKDIHEVMEAFSLYERPLESQLFENDVSQNVVKLESLDTNKKSNKRKRESSDANNLLNKKRKIEKKSTSNKSKDKAHRKKKKREKSEKDSKKNKKKKSKDKVISTKKKLYNKVNKKKKSKEKPEKSKTKKKRKSGTHKTKNVPLNSSIKSENAQV